MKKGVVFSVAILLWWALGAGAFQAAGSAATAVEVRGRILSAIGEPHGGMFAILAGTTREVLFSGRTDNLGEIQAAVQVPEDNETLILLVASMRMLRNTRDEGAVGVDGLPKAMIEIDDWYTPRWSFFDIVGIDDILIRFGADHRRIHFNRGREVVETIAVERFISSDGNLDFGECSYQWVHAPLCIEIELLSEDGQLYRRPVTFSGYHWEQLKKLPSHVYTHVALSQRGSALRILLGPGAKRLLKCDPQGFLTLETELVPNLAFTFRVPLPGPAVDELSRGADRLRFRHTVPGPGSGKPRTEYLANPQEPRYWWSDSYRFY